MLQDLTITYHPSPSPFGGVECRAEYRTASGQTLRLSGYGSSAQRARRHLQGLLDTAHRAEAAA